MEESTILRHIEQEEEATITHTIAHRVARYLERQGLLVRDGEKV